MMNEKIEFLDFSRDRTNSAAIRDLADATYPMITCFKNSSLKALTATPV